MVSSNLDSSRYRPSVHCTRPNLHRWLGQHSGRGGSRPVNDRECSGDRINCVQDRRSAPGSQDWYRGRPDFRGHRQEHTLLRHIHTNWIRYDFVFNPIGPACDYKCDHVELCCQWCLFPYRWYPWNVQCDYKISHCYVFFFTDNMSLSRVLHLRLSWCACQ